MRRRGWIFAIPAAQPRQLLPGRRKISLGSGVRVVAAFQNVPAHVLKKNLDGSIATDVLVCSDDAAAAQVVIQLAKAGGMQAYYAGGLDNAVVVEGLTALLISINKHYGVKNTSIGISGI